MTSTQPPTGHEWEVYREGDNRRRAVLYRGSTRVAEVVGSGGWLRLRMTWIYWRRTGVVRGFRL